MEVEVSTEDMGHVVEDSQSVLQQEDLQKKKRGGAHAHKLISLSHTNRSEQIRKKKKSCIIYKYSLLVLANSMSTVCMCVVDIKRWCFCAGRKSKLPRACCDGSLDLIYKRKSRESKGKSASELFIFNGYRKKKETVMALSHEQVSDKLLNY